MAARVSSAYAACPTVTAVAIAGSRISGQSDDQSDIDLYVYVDEPITLTERTAIAATFATHHEVGITPWEPGDEWIDAQTGLHVDVIFRTPDWIAEQLDRVLVRHEASTGYSTCFWFNVVHSRPLFDRVGWYDGLQASAKRSYPEPLKRAIVAKNHPILRQTRSSYLHQIERAVAREDSVSVQHRVTALLASYFDILFALNEVPHPGEKRLLQFVARLCARTPRDMHARINALLAVAATPPSRSIPDHVNALIDDLDELLREERLIPVGNRTSQRD